MQKILFVVMKRRSEWLPEKKLVYDIAYIVIGPRGGRTLSGNAHTGTLLAATPIVTLKIVEAQFTPVAVLSLYVFLRERKTGRETEKKDAAKFTCCPQTDVTSTRHVIAVLTW